MEFESLKKEKEDFLNSIQYKQSENNEKTPLKQPGNNNVRLQ